MQCCDREFIYAIRNCDKWAVKDFISKGCDVNCIGESGDTPLNLACYHAFENIVEVLIKAGADVNLASRDGEYPLPTACNSYSYTDEEHERVANIVKMLLEHGADPNKYKDGDDGPLHLCAMYNHIKAAKLLIKYGADVNKRGEYGRTPIIYAAMEGNYEIAKMLIKAGADPNIENEAGENALFELITERDDTKMAKLLIKAGIDIKQKNRRGRTLLQWAAFCNRKKTIRLLIELGADVNEKGIYGESAIDEAITQSQLDALNALLEYGADIDSIYYLKSAIELFIKNGEKKQLNKIIRSLKDRDSKELGSVLTVVAGIGSIELMQTLIDMGIDINTRTDEEDSALMKAAYNGKIDMVRFLIERGADINARDYKGSTPLMYAAWSGHTDIVKLLIESGADVNATNNYNWNALMQACVEGHYKTARLLLEAGSRTDLIDSQKGATALTLAMHSGVDKLIELLKSYNAKSRKINKKHSSIFECDICKYLPHKEDSFVGEYIENAPGMIVVYEDTKYPDRFTTEVYKIIKCPICFTYYYEYYMEDTEDDFAEGVSITHTIERTNLLRLKHILKRLGLKDELATFNKRYKSIIKELEHHLLNDSNIAKNLIDYVVENLEDYYITNKDYNAIKENLLNHRDEYVARKTIYDIDILLSGKFYNSTFNYYTEYRDAMPKIQKRLITILKENKNDFDKTLKDILNLHRDDYLSDTIKHILASI